MPNAGAGVEPNAGAGVEPNAGAGLEPNAGAGVEPTAGAGLPNPPAAGAPYVEPPLNPPPLLNPPLLLPYPPAVLPAMFTFCVLTVAVGLAAVPASFSCVRPNALIPNTAPMAI